MKRHRKYFVQIISSILIITLFSSRRWFIPDTSGEGNVVDKSKIKSTTTTNETTTSRLQQRQQQQYQPHGQKQLLRPQQILQQYIEWHSNASLTHDYQQTGVFGIDRHTNDERFFMVGYYSCPMQAGNRLHDFWNSFIVAIVTNRTLLWKYYDPETCYRVHTAFSESPCEITNHETDYSKVLKRSS